jgi:hypothetical protein
MSFTQSLQANIIVVAYLDVQGDYKWYERLYKFIGNKVIATQKLQPTP